MAVATLGAVVLLLLAHRGAVTLVQQSELAHLSATARLVAMAVRDRLDELSERLRELAAASRSDGAVWFEEEAVPFQLRHARYMRALVVVDEEGRPRHAAPGSHVDQSLLAESARVAVKVGGLTPVLRPIGAEGSHALALVVPLQAVGPEREILVALIDVPAIVRAPLAALAEEADGLSFFATPSGEMAAIGGNGQPPGGLRHLDDLAPGLASPLWAVVRERGRVVPAVLAEGATRALALGEPVRVGDATWMVAVVWPRSVAMRHARPLFLLAALLTVLVVGGGTALSVTALRQRRAQVELERELERVRHAAEAGERERRARFIAEEGREPSLYLRDQRIVAANVAAVRALEMQETGELIGRPMAEFVAADERLRVERFLSGRIAGSNVPEQFQTRLVTSRGARRLVEVATSLVEREGGLIEHVTWRDITSRERAEALLRAVAAAVPTALVLTDAAGHLTWANAAFAHAMARPAERFHGRPLLPLVAASDRRRARVLFLRALRGQSSSEELRVLIGEQETAVATTAVPVLVAGDPFGVLLVAADAAAAGGETAPSDRVRRAELLASLAAGVGHRLNNDFQALIGLLEAAGREQRLSQAERRGIEELLGSAAEELRRFVLLARSGPGTLQPLDLARHLARWLARVEPRHAGVRLTLRREVSEAIVVADADQVDLLLDLAVAACRRDLAGGGAIEVGLESVHDGVRLTVFDTAEPAVAADAEVGASLATPGRMLARAVADVIARRHGGAAGGREDAGIGQRLWLDLPLRSDVVAPPLRPPARRQGVVLVADDEQLVRASLTAILRERGWQVDEAADGEETLAKILRDPSRIALVVLDLVMPVVDGREVLRQLRERCPELPVIVCTGYDPSEDHLLTSAEVLVKPFSIEAFVAKVEAELVRPPAERPEPSGTISR